MTATVNAFFAKRGESRRRAWRLLADVVLHHQPTKRVMTPGAVTPTDLSCAIQLTKSNIFLGVVVIMIASSFAAGIANNVTAYRASEQHAECVEQTADSCHQSHTSIRSIDLSRSLGGYESRF